MMAMGGGGGGGPLFKGGGGGNSSRGRPYVLMLLLLVLVAAVFGVMVVHKFRERRIFNLLIQDKDRHLLSLRLLLQKEKEATKEAKRKVEELKAKAYSLRTQKMEFSNKMLEMQSLVSTLKKENRHLDSALREHYNEMKKLKEKDVESNHEKSQRTALAELLKQREVEIEELKNQIPKPTNVWSVSMDDPSNPVVNSTQQSGILTDVESRTSSESEGQQANSKNMKPKEFASGNMDKSRGDEGVGGKNNAGENNVQNAEDSQGKQTVAGGHEGFGGSSEKDDRNTTGMNADSKTDEVQKTKEDEGGDEGATIARELGISKEPQPGKVTKSHDGDGQNLERVTRDGVEQNMRHRSLTHIGSRMVDHGHRSLIKEKIQRIVPREMTENSKDIVSENMRGSRLGENVDSKVVETDRFVYGKEQPGNSQDSRDSERSTSSSVNDNSSGLATDQKSDELTKQAEIQKRKSSSENKYAGENEGDVTGNREAQNFEAAHDVSKEQGKTKSVAVLAEGNHTELEIEENQKEDANGRKFWLNT